MIVGIASEMGGGRPPKSFLNWLKMTVERESLRAPDGGPPFKGP